VGGAGGQLSSVASETVNKRIHSETLRIDFVHCPRPGKPPSHIGESDHVAVYTELDRHAAEEQAPPFAAPAQACVQSQTSLAMGVAGNVRPPNLARDSSHGGNGLTWGQWFIAQAASGSRFGF